MTRYELRTLVSHHEDWLRGERNGVEAGLRKDDVRADFAEITRNLDRSDFLSQTHQSRHLSVGWSLRPRDIAAFRRS
jgi:hypothetical protein